MASKVAPTSKYDIINPSLEPETEEDGYDDFSWGPSLKEEKAAKAKKDAKAELLPVAKKMHVNSYRAQRNSMKERIVNEVLDAALPDVR